MRRRWAARIAKLPEVRSHLCSSRTLDCVRLPEWLALVAAARTSVEVNIAFHLLTQSAHSQWYVIALTPLTFSIETTEVLCSNDSRRFIFPTCIFLHREFMLVDFAFFKRD